MAKTRGYLPLLIVFVLAGLLSVIGVMWVNEKFRQAWDVPHAIYATAGLVDTCHRYKQQHGVWPQPGSYAARDVELVRTYDDNGTRVDVWDFGGGQLALFQFHDNSVEVSPVRGEQWRTTPTTIPSTHPTTVP